MRHDTLLFVLVPVYLMVVGALVIAQMPREEKKPVAMEDKAPVGREPRRCWSAGRWVDRQAGLNGRL